METELNQVVRSEIQHAELPESVIPTPAEAPVEIPDPPVQVVATQLGDVAVDAAKLAELQIRLFEAECRQSALQLVQPVAILSATGVFVVAAVVVLLIAAGTGLHELTGWPLSVSLMLAAVVGIIAAVIAIRHALQLMKTPRITFDKSKDELMRNISLLSRLLKNAR